MLVINLEHEGHRWTSLRDRMMKTTELVRSCMGEIVIDNPTHLSVDEIFVRFLLDRFERDLEGEKSFHRSTVESCPCQRKDVTVFESRDSISSNSDVGRVSDKAQVPCQKTCTTSSDTFKSEMSDPLEGAEQLQATTSWRKITGNITRRGDTPPKDVTKTKGKLPTDLEDPEREAMMHNKRLRAIQYETLPLMYSCKNCDEQYTNSETLRMHVIAAHLPITIPEEDGFTPAEGETKHFTHIQIEMALYQQANDAPIGHLASELRLCPECDRYVEDIRRHVQTHMVLNYICEDCGKGFACDRQLTVHRQYHRPEDGDVMLYACDFCDKTFRSAQSLSTHRPLHNKARNYVCEQCGKSFKDNMRLKKHVGIHAESKRYPCAYCMRRFAQKSNMKRHMRTHTGEKPYGCDLCQQMFNHKASLKNHMKKEHLVEPGDAPCKTVKEIDNFPTGRLRAKRIKSAHIEC